VGCAGDGRYGVALAITVATLPNNRAQESTMSKIDDAADKMKKGTDKAADATKDAAKNAGEKVKNTGDAIKKQGQ
jgi:hypothetical protein